MDNIRIRAIEGERKGKGYAKDVRGETTGRGGTGPGNRNERRGSEPVKWCTKRAEAAEGAWQRPAAAAVFRPHVRARGPRARAGPDVGVLFLFLSFSLGIPFFLSISLSVSPFRPGLTRACSPARRRCSGARQHSLTRNCGGVRTFARVRATEIRSLSFLISPILHRRGINI